MAIFAVGTAGGADGAISGSMKRELRTTQRAKAPRRKERRGWGEFRECEAVQRLEASATLQRARRGICSSKLTTRQEGHEPLVCGPHYNMTQWRGWLFDPGRPRYWTGKNPYYEN